MVIRGLRDYIIADTDNVLLIHPRGEEQRIKQIVEELALPYDEAKRLLLMHGSVKKAVDAYREHEKEEA